MRIYDLFRSNSNQELKITSTIMIVMLSISTLGTVFVDAHLDENIAFAQNHTSNLPASNPMVIDNTFGTSSINREESVSAYPANFTRAMGYIASIQNNEKGEPTWILSGDWDLLLPKSLGADNINSSDATAFNAEFEMVRIDGTERHTHTISDFRITESEVSGNTLVLNGLATVLLNGPLKEAPISISIQDQDVLKLWVKSSETDPEPIDYHFGTTPIYGILSTIGTFLTYP